MAVSHLYVAKHPLLHEPNAEVGSTHVLLQPPLMVRMGLRFSGNWAASVAKNLVVRPV